MNQTCPKCGSDKIIPDATVALSQPAGPRVAIWVFDNPQATFFFQKGRAISELRATVCGDCGHTEFQVRFPKTLWNAHARYLKRTEKTAK